MGFLVAVDADIGVFHFGMGHAKHSFKIYNFQRTTQNEQPGKHPDGQRYMARKAHHTAIMQ
jgi:hypothetical protein